MSVNPPTLGSPDFQWLTPQGEIGPFTFHELLFTNVMREEAGTYSCSFLFLNDTQPARVTLIVLCEFIIKLMLAS